MRLQRAACVSATVLLLLTVFMALAPASGLPGALRHFRHAQRVAAETKPDSADTPTYRKDVEPYLKASCTACHSAQVHSSGFVVDTPEAVLKGGTKYGAKVIVAGHAADSVLIQYLRGQKQPQMPMGSAAAPTARIKKIEAWINAGAKMDMDSAAAQPASSTSPAITGKIVSFRQSVEPFLKANCSSCHSADAHKGGFVVDTPEALFKGSAKTGANVIVPGHSQDSQLIAYLRGQKQPRMPLGGPQTADSQILMLAEWIDQGAKIDAVKLGWPYTAPVVRPLPHVRNTAWTRNPIDTFVLAKLEARGLTPAPAAAKAALLRRVFIDVIGELPTPAEADQFLADTSPVAYPKLVDRLLADPRYGERWGRHWLDLVRYADTHGFENDGVRPRAWRYRDYVIGAFNADKPYDRFLKEQIAGDELYPNDPDAIIATSYARLGPWDELSGDSNQRWQDTLNDVTDTTGSVMLGLTVGCARCHDHKYDRISQADYYRMQAFYAGTKWVNASLPASVNPTDVQKRVIEIRANLDDVRKQAQDLKDKYRTLALAAKQKTAPAGQNVSVNDDEIDAAMKANGVENKQYQTFQDEIHALESDLAPIDPSAEAITDGDKNGPTQHILLRGSLLTPGPAVKPGFVASLVGGQEKPAAITPPPGGRTTGRRTALAEWIGSPQNPMTARVIVNRLWQFHFGRGIVATPSDFGKNGDQPTHPELLDWLALRFMRDGWSVKKMHRLMLLSATYQQSTIGTPRAAKLDSTNKLFFRMNSLRMDAEALRDSILTVSGRLNPERGGPGVYPKVSEEVLSTGSTHKWGSSPEDQQRRRTVYVFQRRSLVLPIVEAFDGADMNNTCPRRGTTTIAPQALALFNGDFGRDESRAFAERVARLAGDNPDQQIAQAYKIALCRPPTPAELKKVRAFLTHKTQMYGTETLPPGRTPAMAALADFCHVLINTNEFLYLD